MHKKDEQTAWEEYLSVEMARLVPLLKDLGYSLEDEQIHTSGEKFLMQAVTTAHGRKLVLIGHRDADAKKVIIKATSDPEGAREIEHERICRGVLKEMGFAYRVFLTPEELLFSKKDGWTVCIQAFIEQDKPFLDRPLEEQFRLALQAFKAQEGAHATTYKHIRLIRKSFGELDAHGYLANFESFRTKTNLVFPDNTALQEIYRKGQCLIEAELENIDQYGGFLTHVDFVPHNFRVSNGEIYLLDHSSLRFGNKYEGWARFLNFMTLYNPPLEDSLTRYVADNRTAEESVSLRMMRIYRLGEIIWYYADTLRKTSGNLSKLNRARVEFWSAVLRAVLDGKKISPTIRDGYIKTRDALRSDDEKRRQIGLH